MTTVRPARCPLCSASIRASRMAQHQKGKACQTEHVVRQMRKRGLRPLEGDMRAIAEYAGVPGEVAACRYVPGGQDRPSSVLDGYYVEEWAHNMLIAIRDHMTHASRMTVGTALMRLVMRDEEARRAANALILMRENQPLENEEELPWEHGLQQELEDLIRTRGGS